MFTRDPRITAAYETYRKTATDECPFCELDDRPIQANETHFVVAPARFPYNQWANREVIEHLMILPKRHVEALHEFSQDESDAYFQLLAHYEKQGYSLYARAPKDTTRSVTHQHTHLLLLAR